MSAGWLMRFASRSPASARLFCFPHAGVGASVFRLWPEGLPPRLEVSALQLPGRANRLREPPIASIPELVQAIVPALLPHLDLPFAFFGHSMGAVLAAEVTRELAARGLTLPRHLLVSGRRPPHVPNPDPPLHPLPDKEFVSEINRRYGGIPAELLQHEDLMALLLPCLRADIKALELHRPAQRAPLSCPLAAFGGSDDRLTPREHLDAWRVETSGAFRVRVFAGDHFYLEPRRAELLADLSVSLAPMLAVGNAQEALA